MLGNVQGILCINLAEKELSHACRSPHNAHGFRMGINTQPEWMDGKMHEVTLCVVGRKGVKTPIRTFSVKILNANQSVAPSHKIDF